MPWGSASQTKNFCGSKRRHRRGNFWLPVSNWRHSGGVVPTLRRWWWGEIPRPRCDALLRIGYRQPALVGQFCICGRVRMLILYLRRDYVRPLDWLCRNATENCRNSMCGDTITLVREGGGGWPVTSTKECGCLDPLNRTPTTY
jgi:hypothetical protein